MTVRAEAASTTAGDQQPGAPVVAPGVQTTPGSDQPSRHGVEARPGSADETRRGVRVQVHGTVQGVGFRPYVYRLATANALSGDVYNAGGYVVIRVAGAPAAVTAFLRRLPAEAPPAARMGDIQVTELPSAALPTGRFRVTESAVRTGAGSPDEEIREVSPDLATCPACRAELFDPADRRYRYPFLNCTDCGPRASIIDDLPYDRQRTAMAGFALCPECAAEYRDPADRRFHAEPVACPRCGPQLWWRPAGATEPMARTGAAFAAAVRALATGGIVALKGLGGYQLVCDAGNEAAVARLRAAKLRPTKPMAVMVPDLAAARAAGYVSAAEAALLTEPASPIVLVARRPGDGLAPAVCGGLGEVGLFLPYSPLHHLLLGELLRPLVVTSGNRSGEPIVIDDDIAVATLGPLVDGLLGHDRPILARYDDSVARVVAGRPTVIRRARGYAPAPVALPVPAPEPVLAVGAQLKHTTALAVGGYAIVGPHTGDLENPATLDAFADTAQRLCRWEVVAPNAVAHDLHPGYLSTRYAVDRYPAQRRIGVQHHHAHVAATAAEHGVEGPFIGVAYDGLGMGDDGTLWGGELLLAGYTEYQRLGRFARAPLPGGAAAVRRPARMALGYLFGGEDLGSPRVAEEFTEALLARLDPHEVAVVRRMVQRGINTPVASSAGRLFDAVASLLGLCDDAGYEGEAAVRLEAAVGAVDGAAAGAVDRHGAHEVTALPWRLVERDGLLVYDTAPTLRAVCEHQATWPVARVAAAFHATLAEVTRALVAEAHRRTGVRAVCLGGGVFVNRRLTTAVFDGLARDGFEVYVGQRVPVNDGGISYGQAAVAAATLAKG